MDTITRCPVCQQTDFESYLTCEDHLTSHETFTLQKCRHCALIFTNPRPDAADLERYYHSEHYISHTSKSTGPLDLLYLIARRFTLRWKVRQILRFTKPQTLLDFGCGTGEFLVNCSQHGFSIQGLEPAAVARQKAAEQTGITIAASLHEVPLKQFDVITLWHVLEHVPNLGETIDQLASSLKPDGKLFIAVPNPGSPDAAFYREHWAAYDVPRHLWHFTKQTMEHLLEASGLRVIAIVPMKLDAFYISLLSEKYSSPKRNSLASLLRGLIQGLTSNWQARNNTNHSSLLYIISR